MICVTPCICFDGYNSNDFSSRSSWSQGGGVAPRSRNTSLVFFGGSRCLPLRPPEVSAHVSQITGLSSSYSRIVGRFGSGSPLFPNSACRFIARKSLHAYSSGVFCAISISCVRPPGITFGSDVGGVELLGRTRQGSGELFLL